MATEIEALQLGIKVNSESANRKLDAFVKKISEIKSVLTGIDEDKMAALNMAMGSGVGASKPVEEIKKAADEGNTAMKTLKSSTTEVSDAAKSTGTSGAEEMEKIAQAADSTSGKMGGLEAGFKNLLSPLKKFGSLFSDIMRIAKYRMIRSVIKQITQGFSEGMKNLFEYSKSINGTFAEARDKVTTATAYLKNSIGAMMGVLYEAAAPVIDKMIDGIVEGLNYVNRMIAAISGKSRWTKAIKNLKHFNDETKRTILGIDEINKLNGDENSNALLDFSEIELAADEILDLKSQFQTILTTVGFIGAGILAWKLSAPFMKSLGTLQNLKLGAGITFMVAGVSLAFAGGKELAKDFKSGKGWTETILGVLGSTIGGALIGATIAPGVGTGFGAILGFTIGVVGTFAGFGAEMSEEFKTSVESTEVWKYLDDLQSKIDDVSKSSTNVKDRLAEMKNALTKTTDYDVELQLLDEIETLGKKTNLTSTEMETLKQKIDTLNSYGNVGEGLKFDELTGQILGSVDAVRDLINSLKREAQLEAYRDMLKEAYKAQGDATINQAGALANLREAQQAEDEIKRALFSVQSRIPDAYTEVQNGVDGAKEKYNDLREAERMLIATHEESLEVLESAKASYEDTVSVMEESSNMVEVLDSAIEQLSNGQDVSISKMAELLGGTDKVKDATANFQDGLHDIMDPLEKYGIKLYNSNTYLGNMSSKLSTVSFKIKKFAKTLQGIQFENMFFSQYERNNLTKWPNLSPQTPRKFANGGFPSQGSMFIANESGAEMVGTIGNRTAVANTGDITTAISDAVYQAFSSAGGNGGNITIQMMDESGNVRSEKYISAAQKRNLRDGKITLPVGV